MERRELVFARTTTTTTTTPPTCKIDLNDGTYKMDNAHPSISASTNNFLTVPDALSNEAQALLLNTERYPHRHHVARTKQPKPSIFTTPHLHISTMMLIILSLGNMCTALDVKALSEKAWSVAEVEGAFTAKISTRDEGGPAPICLYMTTEPDWKGEGMNVCAVGGFCGMRSLASPMYPIFTSSPTDVVASERFR